jgi:hypothetical protein
MTTPEPVAPAEPTRTSMETTAGVTRAAMSDTEPGSRLMPASTSESSVPGAISGDSAAERVRYQPRPPPTAPTSRTASSTSAETRTERSRRRSFFRPRASTITGPGCVSSS